MPKQYMICKMAKLPSKKKKYRPLHLPGLNYVGLKEYEHDIICFGVYLLVWISMVLDPSCNCQTFAVLSSHWLTVSDRNQVPTESSRIKSVDNIVIIKKSVINCKDCYLWKEIVLKAMEEETSKKWKDEKMMQCMKKMRMACTHWNNAFLEWSTPQYNWILSTYRWWCMLSNSVVR